MEDTFRKSYTALTDNQKAEMLAVKEKAEELEALFSKAFIRNARLVSIAKTHLETAVLFAVKAVTTQEGTGNVTEEAKA